MLMPHLSSGNLAGALHASSKLKGGGKARKGMDVDHLIMHKLR